VIEHVPVAVPFEPLSVASQFWVPSLTLTCPLGVGDPGVVLSPLTCTLTETLWPTTGLAVTEVIVVVVVDKYVYALPSESTAAQKLAVGHETEYRGYPAMLSGDDHELPL
jgi:hypothetical protein